MSTDQTERSVSRGRGRFDSPYGAAAWVLDTFAKEFDDAVKVKISVEQFWDHEGEPYDPAGYTWSAHIVGSTLDGAS